MASTGKLVLLRKDDGEFFELIPVTAIGIEASTGLVIIEQEIELPGLQPHTVTRELLFDYDPDLMNAINNLMTSAKHNMSSAKQLFELEAIQTTFTEDENVNVRFH